MILITITRTQYILNIPSHANVNMPRKNVIVIFLAVLSIYPCHSAKILGVFPLAIRSHYILANALLRGLAEAGHDVTMVSPFVEKDPPKKGSWRDVVLTGMLEEHEEMAKRYVSFSTTQLNPVFSALLMPTFGSLFIENALNHTNVQRLVKSDEKYDVVLVGQVLNDAMKGFATHFNAHLVIFSTVGANSMVNHLVGSPSLPSFSPEMLANFPPRMSFFQRVHNTIIKFLFSGTMRVFVYPRQDGLLKQYISESLSIDDVLYNASLLLLNSHVSIASPQPRVPCVIEIGGFHIRPPKKLPDDLQSFLDDATEGVIYMSMGTNLQSKDLPPEKTEAILNTFSKLKQKVLWKWEDDVLPGQPSNVKLGKWLPQQDILAHPNVRVFITHGGLLSTTETIYHGVPIIAIPILGDQKMNAYTAETAGYGIVLLYEDLSEETLTSSLEEILTKPKYTEEVQRRSKIMKDRQIEPLDEAVYWIEYVIRHNGARHLRVAYLDLAWYQYYLLDVFAFIFAVIVASCFLLKRIVNYLCCRTKRTKLKTS